MTTLLDLTDPDKVTRTLENVRKYFPNGMQRHLGRLEASGNISIVLTTYRHLVLR
jgi:hypothetical protein